MPLSRLRMMHPRTEARFAVGGRHSLRSSIWKAQAQGEEAYIFNRMFGADAKVSLHSSGECQWSATDNWVVRTKALRNADRHFAKWKVIPPTGDVASMAFRVDIPVSEIRHYEAPRDKKKVFWISGAPVGSTVRVIFYLTRISDAEPTLGAMLPHRHLFSLRFRSGRWLVALFDLISLSETNLHEVRQAIRRQHRDAGLMPTPELRACAFMEAQEGEPQGLLELCLDESNQGGGGIHDCE